MLCLQSDGNVVKGDPFEVCKVAGQRNARNIDGTNDDLPPIMDLDQIRHARMEEMKQQKKMADHWRSLGHGRYREIDDERAFFKEVAPHERAVCVIHEECDDLQNTLHESISHLAEKHIETAFLRLRASKAHFMMQMVKFDTLPSILVLRHGQVISSLDARQIRGSSRAQLERLLWTRDVLGVGEGGDSHSEVSSDEDSDHY
eukprot:GEMP01066282.1.p1 GENE.GEMP01066282.1~~GEMP01066282.1.p1  ORF type:complete len:202 (+),score=40.28 GEMP01066282.1:232-837(+)